MNTPGNTAPQWLGQASTPRDAHACNCIGCCDRCGTCRTWHGHTPLYCDLLVSQKVARDEILGTQRRTNA